VLRAARLGHATFSTVCSLEPGQNTRCDGRRLGRREIRVTGGPLVLRERTNGATGPLLGPTASRRARSALADRGFAVSYARLAELGLPRTVGHYVSQGMRARWAHVLLARFHLTAARMSGPVCFMSSGKMSLMPVNSAPVHFPPVLAPEKLAQGPHHGTDAEGAVPLPSSA